MKKMSQPTKSLSIIILVLLNFAIINDVSAKQPEIRPFVKTSFKQIQREHKESPYIITFWSESCAFCMKELALFGKLLKRFPNVTLVSITTDPFLNNETIKQILSSKGIEKSEKWVFADDFVERLYFDVEPRWRGELPLTYFFDKNNTMLKHMGVIKENELIDWLSKNQTN